MILRYTEECIQSLKIFDDWWIEDTSKKVSRGRLIQAYVPHVGAIPNRLSVAGRSDPTDHTRANFEIEPFRYGDKKKHLTLPVAALPAYSNEELLVFQSKKRPLLVVADNSQEVDKRLTLGKPGWQTAPTLLVAPYYGRDEGTGARAGFNDEFVVRIRQ